VVVECDYVLLAVGQTTYWGELLEGSNAIIDEGMLIEVDELTYQSAQPDIFAGGDAVTGPKYAIDAIAAGKQGAISIHRFVQPGQDLRLGRSKREFKEFDTASAIIENYDNTPRQRPAEIDSKKAKKTFDNLTNLLTEEQIRKETERCLGCGVTVVDEYMCVGCGMCVTKCKFEAITLKREYDGEGVAFLDIKKNIIPHIIKRKVKIKTRQILGRK